MADARASPAPTATPLATPPSTPPLTPPPTPPVPPPRAGARSPSAARRKGESEEREGAATPDGRDAAPPPENGDARATTPPQLVRCAVAAGAGAGDAAAASVGVQASAPPPYRLRVLPDLRGGCARVAVRAALSQAGLAALLLLWALLGAWAFRAAEGPHERQRADGVRLEQRRLAEGLAEAARRVAADAGACGAPTAAAAETTTETGATTDADAAQRTWLDAANDYVRRHEQMLLEAVDDGFGEGGGGPIWTFAGCLLFAVSLLTTLGFGAPVPRTTAGRAAAAVFAAVGIPLHLLLVLNAGALAAAHLTRAARRHAARRRARSQCGASAAGSPRAPCPCVCPLGGCGWRPQWPAACPVAWPCQRRRGECAPAPGPVPARGPLPAVAPTDAGDKVPPPTDAPALEAGERKAALGTALAAAAAAAPDGPDAAAEEQAPPRWLHWAPAAAAAAYYVAGVLAFGAARGRPPAACLLFPLDFTATGGVGRVAGGLRAFYALYLEGAVLLAATGVALHQAAAARGLTALGLRWGLLTDDA